MLRKFSLAVTVIASFVLIAACSASSSSERAETLVLYSGRSEELIAPLIEMFQEETGIEVQVRYGHTAEVAATLMEEGENSPADLFYAQDPGGLGAVAEAGLFAELPASLTNLVDARFRSPDGLWVGVSGRARVVVYNTDNVAVEDLPADMHGFTDPQWKGRIGLPPTNSSFQTMVTALRQEWGEDAARAWLEGIMANEPQFYEKNTPVVAAVGAGEVDVGFVNHYYLMRFLTEEGDSFPARNYFLPDGGPGSLIMTAGIGLLKTSPHQANALRFIEFLLSKPAQEYFAAETFEYPLAAGVPAYSALTPLSELHGIDIDPAHLSDLQGTVKLLQDVGMLP